MPYWTSFFKVKTKYFIGTLTPVIILEKIKCLSTVLPLLYQKGQKYLQIINLGPRFCPELRKFVCSWDLGEWMGLHLFDNVKYGIFKHHDSATVSNKMIISLTQRFFLSQADCFPGQRWVKLSANPDSAV